MLGRSGHIDRSSERHGEFWYNIHHGISHDLADSRSIFGRPVAGGPFGIAPPSANRREPVWPSSLSIWANAPLPGYEVVMPPAWERWYGWAAPTLLAVAITWTGLWVARSRSVRTTGGRAMLFVAVGAALASYTAWWVWFHRDGHWVPLDAATVPINMPWIWLLACSLVFVVGWRRVWQRPMMPGEQKQAEPSAEPDRARDVASPSS